MNAQQCYQAIGCQAAERLVIIKEQNLADANFVFSYLMKQAFSDEDSRVILVLTHNSLGHYECVAKKLGYSLRQKVKLGSVKLINVQGIVLKSFQNDSLNALQDIQVSIDQFIKEFLRESPNRTIHVFFDDFTHIQDVACDLRSSINFLNELLAGYYDDPHVKYIVGIHIGNEDNQILSGDLEYSADCIIDVSLMKTGRSDDISGVLKVLRNRKLTTYHYKMKEYGVNISAPGNFLFS